MLLSIPLRVQATLYKQPIQCPGFLNNIIVHLSSDLRNRDVSRYVTIYYPIALTRARRNVSTDLYITKDRKENAAIVIAFHNRPSYDHLYVYTCAKEPSITVSAFVYSRSMNLEELVVLISGDCGSSWPTLLHVRPTLHVGITICGLDDMRYAPGEFRKKQKLGGRSHICMGLSHQ